jgi:hypothetical protein
VGRGLLVAGALALLGGAGVLGYGLTRPKAAAVVDTTPYIAKFEEMLTNMRQALSKRVEGVAAEEYVRAGLSSDAATAQEMKKTGELALLLQPNEILELGQTIDGKSMPLLVLPDGAVASGSDGKIGDKISANSNGLTMSRLATVQLKYTTVAPAGYVRISQPIPMTEFADLNKQLVAASAGFTIVVGDKSFKSITKPLQLDPSLQVTMAVAMPATDAKPFLIGGGAALAAGVLLLIVGASRTRKPATTTAVVSTSIGLQRTEATGLGVGTPASVPPGASGEFALTPASLGPGVVLGRWQIERRLGSGGMADVFQAKSIGEAGFAKTVALKIMHSHLARNERAVDHFLDEARLASQIHHPNVVQILDLGKIGGEYAIAMEFVDGVDLDNLLQAARMAGRAVPLNIAVSILRRICDGIGAAHNAVSNDGVPLQVVHRDVKAANVLVSRQGSVKVVDFGIAKAAVQSHFTVAGETKGTPSMMAPEQRVGDPVDKRADVYSLAAVGYELLTGAAVNLDLAAIAHLGIEGWPHLPQPSALRADLPQAFDNIMLTAMSYDRKDRPESCEVFEAQIERIATQHHLVASDKDIGRWVTSELELAPKSGGDSTQVASRPVM